MWEIFWKRGWNTAKITFTLRGLIDRDLAEGLEDLKHGRTHGPYGTAEEAVAALESRVQRRTNDW